MKTPAIAVLFALALVAACSFEVEQPKSSKSAPGRYQLSVVDIPRTDENVLVLLDTTTGALHEQDGSRWRLMTDPLER